MVVHEGLKVSGWRAYLNWGELGMNQGYVGCGKCGYGTGLEGL